MIVKEQKKESNSVVINTAKVIGVYRFFIDGTVLVALAGMLWAISEWKTSTELSIAKNASTADSLRIRVERIEQIEKEIGNLPITREAHTRLTILETAVAGKFESIEKSLANIERKVDNLEKKP